ncbi:MAG: hypothetical protein ACFFE6_09920, partial [Candidatus Thorarchaeota archaeon]
FERFSIIQLLGRFSLAKTWLSVSMIVMIVLTTIGPIASSIVSSNGNRSSLEIVFTSPDNLISEAMALDSEDNVIVVGSKENRSLPFGKEFFIAKFSPDGETLWHKKWNKTENDLLTDCKVDSIDNIIVTGVSGIEEDEFATVYKLDSSGEIIWEVEILGLTYAWPGPTFLGIQIDKSTDKIFIVGALSGVHYRTLVMHLNSSGSILWTQEWIQKDGSVPYSFWLTSLNQILVTGVTYDYGYSEYSPSDRFVTAYNYTGFEVWNQTGWSWYYGLEINNSSFVAISDLGIGELQRYDYNLNRTWEMEVQAEGPYFETLTHLTLNGTDRIVGCGMVQHQQAAYVTKAFHPSYSPAPKPQTLVFSCTVEGELEWYDFLIQGLISEPCGCAFNSQGELVIAGHMNNGDYDNDLYVVFGFQPTPFPMDLTPTFLWVVPGLNIIAVAIFYRLQKRIGVSLQDSMKAIIVANFILLALMYIPVLNPLHAPMTEFWPPWIINVFLGLHVALGVLVLIFLILRVRSLFSS